MGWELKTKILEKLVTVDRVKWYVPLLPAGKFARCDVVTYGTTMSFKGLTKTNKLPAVTQPFGGHSSNNALFISQKS